MIVLRVVSLSITVKLVKLRVVSITVKLVKLCIVSIHCKAGKSRIVHISSKSRFTLLLLFAIKNFLKICFDLDLDCCLKLPMRLKRKATSLMQKPLGTV